MKIVFATDGSEHSEAAAQFLSRFHFSPHDEIIVLHVVSEIPYDDDYHAQIRHVIKKVAPKILHATQKLLKPLRAQLRSLEEEGIPDTTVIQVAEDSGADLIVMGARGLKSIKSFLLGSVTRSVAINSPKPVLVVKPLEGKTSEKMSVLFATDGSSSSLATAAFLGSLPFPEGTELVLMNVAWSAASDIPERFVMEVDDKIKEHLARARSIEMEASKKIIDQTTPYLGKRFTKITGISKGGDPSMEIIDEAVRIHADLIAVGSRGLKGVRGMLGSVSRRVLGHAHCPVLIGKESGG